MIPSQYFLNFLNQFILNDKCFFFLLFKKLSKLRKMSDDENQWKWNEFVEIGNTIHKMRGVVRTERAKAALNFSDDLLRTKYITDSRERYELYKTLLPIIACYLDGNTEVIQAAVKEYFLIRHCKAGLDENQFQVSFSSKKSGIQSGFTCDIVKQLATSSRRISMAQRKTIRKI
jgi:hypothetical protein